MLHIGPYTIEGKTVLAPMAGVTDSPFRHICQSWGARYTVSEMLTSDTRLWQTNKSARRLTGARTASPVCMQIAGSDPVQMAIAAQECVARGADIIDLNMGCPAKKVCKKLAGSALLKDEGLVEKIISAVVSQAGVPVTLKMRTGWDDTSRNGVKIAAIAEQNGISLITVHGRTRACRFENTVEYDTIAEIVSRTSIPIVANGDINSAEKADQVLKYTRASAVMVGRAALGNPWIFNQINTYLEQAKLPAPPSVFEIKKTLLQHLGLIYELYGDNQGVKIARKHIAWYCRTLGISSEFVQQFYLLQTTESQIETIQYLFDRSNTYEEIAA